MGLKANTKAIHKIEDGKLIVELVPSIEELLKEPPIIEISLEEFHKFRKELSQKAETSFRHNIFTTIIGIAVKNIPSDALTKLLQRRDQVFVSNITIFEMTAKGAKYVALRALPPERVTKGVRALTYNESIKKLEMHESTILHVAFKIRSLLSDFIDCLILSSAINQCDALVTEDEDIHQINKNRSYQELIATKNPKFKI